MVPLDPRPRLFPYKHCLAAEKERLKKEVIPLYEEENEALDIIEMTDDEGNTILMQVVDYFFYNGEEYVILTDSIHDDDCDCEECHHEHEHGEQCACGCEDIDETEEITCYIMKVIESTVDGEEVEEFVPVEDQALEAKLIEIATTKLNAEDDEE